MERTRAAVFAALSVLLSVVGAAFATAASPVPVALGAVAWPVSTLLVSEVQTGGASASDEFAEITNVGASAVDLAGLELAYATSTGSTVTRKASWSTSLLLDPGRHLFVANALGIYAALADATYSGGFAATGGAIVLRAIGGATIDAVGWGDATNAFVEGSPVAAPAAGASIERKPGDLAGNTMDTNANATDWFAQSTPNPQSLAAPPVPAPTPTAAPTASPGGTASPTAATTPAPTPAPTATPAATPVPTATPAPTASSTPSPTVDPAPTLVPTVAPTPEPTVEPTSLPTATPSPEPSLAPTAEPTIPPTPEPTLPPTPAPTIAPTPEPTLPPTPVPTITPTPAPTPVPTATPQPIASIAAARALPDGSTATILGVLTTSASALESGRKGFVQDDSAGIALYLDTAAIDGLPEGTLVMATGTIDDRFAERTLRVNLADLVPLGEGVLPAPVLEATGSIGEAVEGTRVVVAGTTDGSPSDLADGLGLMVDDGTGQVRVIVSPEALGGASVPAGTGVIAVGPVGQRDSSGTDLAGYRIHVTVAGEFQILPPPSPSPTASPSPAPTPSPTPAPTTSPSPAPSPTRTPGPTSVPTATPGATASPTAGATPRPTATPTATPGPTSPPVIDIVEARGASVGTVVTVTGVVTAEAGRLGLPPDIAIADGTGGIAVRLPEGAERPARGTTVLVRGALADPYGQLEIRPAATGYTVIGRGSLPGAIRLTASQLGEATEGRLAELVGTVSVPPRKGTSGDLTIDLVDAAGTPFRVLADSSSEITAADLVKDRSYRLIGIVGQRASRKGALDGYRLYVRDSGDIAAVAGDAGPGGSASPGATAAAVPVSTALAVPDGTRVTIEAIVTAGANLLDGSGRRIVAQDDSGAIEILLPTGAEAPAMGARLRVTGTTGLAWGAPRIAATEVATLGAGAAPQPLTLRRAPAERDEWLLVRLSGTIAKVSRIGERWRAELTLADGTAALIQGQAGAGIPSTSIAAGQRVTVTGIVRRPYPTASDRRFAVLPRSTADLEVPAAGTGTGSGAGGSGSGGGQGGAAKASADPGAAAVTPDTDLATLADLIGQRVKVGGLIARIADDGFDLDDGTALARVELRGEMRGLLPHLRRGEAVAATGTVELVDSAPVVVVDDEGTLVRVGTLGEGLPIGDAPAPAPSDADGGGPITADSSGGFGGLGGPGPASLFALASLTGLSVLATVLRRRLLRRRLRFALLDRLGGLPGRRAQPGQGTSSTGSTESEHEFA